jgi:hypothetical protein
MTTLDQFYPALRLLLQDTGDVKAYPDDILADGLRTMIRMNKVPAYALTGDQNAITPDALGDGSDPNVYALMIYHTVKLFIGGTPDRYSFRTRALSESFGSATHFLTQVELEIHALESGECIQGWQTFHDWLAGVSGLPLGLVLT